MATAVRREHSPAREEGTTDAGRLFGHYSDRIFGYCLRFLGSRADAEDAVQTTFLYAHRALERGVVPESEYAWLHTIAKNVCRWQQRTTARRSRVLDGVDLDLLPGPHGDDGDATELLMGLEEALASIPEGQRRAILLREWQGLSCQEVASRLGTSQAATHALLTRARRSLAKALTALPQRPVLGLDLGPLLLKLKALVAGGTANVAATATVVAAVAVGGGVVVEEVINADRPRPSARAVSFPTGLDASGRMQATAPRSFTRTRASSAATTRMRTPRDGVAAEMSPHDGATIPDLGAGDSPDVPSPADDPLPGASPPAALPVPELPESPVLPTDPLELLTLPELPGSDSGGSDGLLPPLGEIGDGPDDVPPNPPEPPSLPEAELPGLP